MFRLLSIACAMGVLGLGAAAAQNFPAKPITIVVPASPGGVTDLLARTLAVRFTEAWGQQVVVENKPGANNQIAAEYVAKSPPDGHTLMIGPEVTFVVNPSLYGRLNYDPVKDFTPISGLISINHSLVVNPALPAKDVKELIALAKSKPGEMNYGTFGVGSTGHLNMEMFQKYTGAKFTPVHYKGATPALTDVMAGHIQMMFISVGSAVPVWKDNRVRLLAIGADKRLTGLGDTPIIGETVPGFEAMSWFGLFGPANVPTDIRDKINAEVRRTFADPNIRKTLLEPQFFQSIAGTPEQLADRIKSEEPKWREVVRAANIKID